MRINIFYIRTLLFCTAISMLAGFSAAFLILSSVICSVYGITICGRYGVVRTILMSILVSLITAVFYKGAIIQPPLAIAFSGVLGGLALFRGKNGRIVLINITLSHILTFIISVLTIQIVNNQNLFNYVMSEEYVNGISAAIRVLYPSIKSENVTEMVSQIKSFIYTLIPSAVIIYSFILGILTMYGLRIAMHKKGVSYPFSISVIVCDKVSAILYFLFIALFFFVRNTNILAVIINLIVVLSVYILICGLGAIDYYLEKGIKSRILRAIIYLISFVIPFLIFAIILFGIVDAFFKFRSLDKKREEEAEDGQQEAK